MLHAAALSDTNTTGGAHYFLYRLSAPLTHIAPLTVQPTHYAPLPHVTKHSCKLLCFLDDCGYHLPSPVLLVISDLGCVSVRICAQANMVRYSNEFKALVTKRARKTRNIKQTARIYGVSYSTVKRWMSLAAVPVRRHHTKWLGRPCKLPAQVQAEIRKQLLHGQYSLRGIANALTAKGYNVSHVTVRNVARRGR